MKIKILITTLVLTATIAFGQKKTTFHKELFSKKISEKTKELESGHPSVFFEVAAEKYKDNKLNDAAFLYYLGKFRYKYYIACHPELPPDGDPAILASFQSVIGGEINLKLGESFENYIKIIEAVIEWIDLNDSKFIPKDFNSTEYTKTLNGLKDLKNYLIDNKDKLIEQRKKNLGQ